MLASATGALVWALIMIAAQAAWAQSTTYRLEIRKAEVVENNDFRIFFSLLNSNQQAIKKIDLKDLKRQISIL